MKRKLQTQRFEKELEVVIFRTKMKVSIHVLGLSWKDFYLSSSVQNKTLIQRLRDSPLLILPDKVVPVTMGTTLCSPRHVGLPTGLGEGR